jgi:Bacterial Ig-like domain
MLVRRLAGAAILLAGCAKIEPPPGGPPDPTPPQLVTTRPDSFALLPDFKGSVEFRFDEVISEGSSPNLGTGTGDLERLVILSPTTLVPKVEWRRDRITVHPAEGWRRDRVYRVELLPGVTDLHRNRSKTGRVITFSTGPPLPTAKLDGMVVDWSSARPAAAALVEAILMPDSLPYRALTDSGGKFTLGPVPDGMYVVRGVLDENHNLRADGREAFDSVLVKRGTSAVGELWAFVHDTTPPRIRSSTIRDSLSAVLEFTEMLDPRQRFDTSHVRVRLLPDSTPVRVVSLLPQRLDDSLHAPQRTGRDTTGRDTTRRDTLRADTTAPRPPPGDTTERGRAGRRQLERVAGQLRGQAAAAAPLTTRPALFDNLVVRVAQPRKPDAKYNVEIIKLRNVTGVPGSAHATLTVPKPGAADSLRPPGDSTKRGSPRKKPK